MRPSRRQPDELRAVSLERGVVKYAEGSCFVKFGDTHVLVHGDAGGAAAALAQGPGRAAGSPPNTACCRAPPRSARGARPRPASRAAARSRSSA